MISPLPGPSRPLPPALRADRPGHARPGAGPSAPTRPRQPRHCLSPRHRSTTGFPADADTPAPRQLPGSCPGGVAQGAGAPLRAGERAGREPALAGARRTRAGRTAAKYHTARFILVPSLREELTVAVPAERSPGQPWAAGPPVATAEPEVTAVPIRIGYARWSSATQELQSQLDALTRAH